MDTSVIDSLERTNGISGQRDSAVAAMRLAFRCAAPALPMAGAGSKTKRTGITLSRPCLELPAIRDGATNSAPPPPRNWGAIPGYAGRFRRSRGTRDRLASNVATGRLPSRHAVRGLPVAGFVDRVIGVAAWTGFWRDQRASVAVETAIAVSVLVIAFAGIVQIVHSAYVSDRMGRAARAAVHAVALSPGTKAASLASLVCKAIRNELDLGDGFDCTKKLSVKIDRKLIPGDLTKSGGSRARNGELALIWIAWSGGRWNPGELLANDDEDARRAVLAVARLEPAQGS